MKLGTRIFISGLMASIVVTGTIIIIGLLIIAFTDEQTAAVKIFCVVFCVTMEAYFATMFVLLIKIVWGED